MEDDIENGATATGWAPRSLSNVKPPGSLPCMNSPPSKKTSRAGPDLGGERSPIASGAGSPSVCRVMRSASPCMSSWRSASLKK
ncbi:MAG TPA: hypothetical protein VF386_00535 [Usitatibacter sp.]